ncbi:MAG: hypothetical protein JW931_00840 [Methanomicrobiaceae archaeon]|nr:hypothetical protein [Methanomicrobiaceae archaeon]
MSGNRKLSIGITVNLENYENLKVEVDGEVKDGEDAGELMEYLDIVLSRLGRNDPETKKRIDSYRRRVLESPGGHIKTDFREPKADLPPAIPQTTVEPEATPAPAGPEVKAGEPEKEKAPEKKIPEATGFTCSACGMPISKAEEQLSQIFMGRSLCKKCLDDMQK